MHLQEPFRYLSRQRQTKAMLLQSNQYIYFLPIWLHLWRIQINQLALKRCKHPTLLHLLLHFYLFRQCSTRSATTSTTTDRNKLKCARLHRALNCGSSFHSSQNIWMYSRISPIPPTIPKYKYCQNYHYKMQPSNCPPAIIKAKFNHILCIGISWIPISSKNIHSFWRMRYFYISIHLLPPAA